MAQLASVSEEVQGHLAEARQVTAYLQAAEDLCGETGRSPRVCKAPRRLLERMQALACKKQDQADAPDPSEFSRGLPRSAAEVFKEVTSCAMCSGRYPYHLQVAVASSGPDPMKPPWQVGTIHRLHMQLACELAAICIASMKSMVRG